MASMPENAPYLDYYLDILQKKNIAFDVCAWDRYGSTVAKTDNLFVFRSFKQRGFFLEKIFGYVGYRRFLLQHFRSYSYDRVILFTLPSVVLIGEVVSSGYRNKYIVDIRDYSPLMALRYFARKISKSLSHSYANVISSEGFKKWLPNKYDYLISHNTNFPILKDVDMVRRDRREKIKILTIGALRDFDSNLQLINSLADNMLFQLQFSGKGVASAKIAKYIEKHEIMNAFVTGPYQKVDESTLVSDSDMLNVLLPHNMVSDFLMSNRFYLSVIYGKPMLVNEGCTQAYFVQKYDLGLVITPGDDIAGKVIDYWMHFSLERYNLGRKKFMELVQKDYKFFLMTLDAFLE